MGMTREEAIKYGIAWLKDEYLDAKDGVFIEMALETLKQQPCEDCISREAVLDLCDSKDPEYKVRYFKEDVECLPPVTPQQKTGRWIEHKANGMSYIECSKCSTWFLRMYLTRNSYCPNCGAKMQEVEQC